MYYHNAIFVKKTIATAISNKKALDENDYKLYDYYFINTKLYHHIEY